MNRLVVATLLAVSLSTNAFAQSATFSAVKDAVPGRNFNAALSIADGNHLIVGLDTGLNPLTWQVNDFQAAQLAYNVPSTADTLAFVVTAPAGYYVSRVTYSQRGTQDISRTGRSFATTLLTVQGQPVRLPGDSPTVTGAVATTGKPQSVSVTVSTSLVSQASSVRVSGADVFVELVVR